MKAKNKMVVQMKKKNTKKVDTMKIKITIKSKHRVMSLRKEGTRIRKRKVKMVIGAEYGLYG